MNVVGLALLAASSGAADGTCANGSAVVVVAEGSAGAMGQRAAELAETLSQRLGTCGAVKVAWYDAEPSTANPAVQDLGVGPRTAMRDTMEIGFTWLKHAAGQRTMIVIAHEQFYPSAMSSGRLVELARLSNATIHTVEVQGAPARSGAFRRFGGALRDGLIWLFEAIGEDEHGYSAAHTARLLKRLSAETGGQSCVVRGDSKPGRCLEIVTARLVGAE